MKVGLIQVDGKWANLALMKLSAWHKKKGDVKIMSELELWLCGIIIPFLIGLVSILLSAGIFHLERFGEWVCVIIWIVSYVGSGLPFIIYDYQRDKKVKV
jgi:hypothetical protein